MDERHARAGRRCGGSARHAGRPRRRAAGRAARGDGAPRRRRARAGARGEDASSTRPRRCSPRSAPIASRRRGATTRTDADCVTTHEPFASRRAADVAHLGSAEDRSRVSSTASRRRCRHRRHEGSRRARRRAGDGARRARVPSPDAVADDARRDRRRSIDELRAKAPRSTALGVGAAGMVDLDGVIHYAPNVPGLPHGAGAGDAGRSHRAADGRRQRRQHRGVRGDQVRRGEGPAATRWSSRSAPASVAA